MTYGKVIGIYSSMPHQGKSEIRRRLVEKHGFRHLPFARILKRMAMVFLVEIGYPEATALELIENDKNTPLTRVPGMPTARHLMQTLGTEWGRHNIHPTIWTAEWESKAGVWSRSGVGIVADDMRFPNEVEAVKRLGGQIWRVERPGVVIDGRTMAHVSEGSLNELKFDRVIANDGTIGKFWQKIDKAITRTGKNCNDV